MDKDDPRLKNLKPVKPGDPSRGGGRPKGSLNRSTIFKRWMEADCPMMSGITNAEYIARRMVLDAMTADKYMEQAKEALDSAYGKNADKIRQVDAYDQDLKAAELEVLAQEGIKVKQRKRPEDADA